ncbi:KTSC domain-containing protein [Homoserinimonas sp. A447]
MHLDPIDSDALDGVSYDAASRTLTVKFESGGVYEYFDVEQSLFDELQRSQPHPWSVVGDTVKAHRFRRLA